MKKRLLKYLPFFIMASFMVTGCNLGNDATITDIKPVIEANAKKSAGSVYKGKILGKSNKAKSISISVGKGKNAKTVMVKFDDKTKGVEHAAKGHASIIFYEMRDGQPWATVIKPKLAKLPPGVTEIKLAELKQLIERKGDLTLIDARPGKRFAVGHMPGAINIGAKAYKKSAPSMLPKEKDALLIVYCGGPT